MNRWTRVKLCGDSGAWVLKPDHTHKYGNLFRGSLIIRGGLAALEFCLRALDASDDETEPKRKLLIPHKLWMELIDHGTSRYIWVREEKWEAFIQRYGYMPAISEMEASG